MRVAFKDLMCVYSHGSPFNAFATCPPPLLSFISQMGYWLLAASHYLSLKARSTQLACFVLPSLLLGFSVTFYFSFSFFSLFSWCRMSQKLKNCSILHFTRDWSHLQYRKFISLLSIQASTYRAAALLNEQPLETSLHSGLHLSQLFQ